MLDTFIIPKGRVSDVMMSKRLVIWAGWEGQALLEQRVAVTLDPSGACLTANICSEAYDAVRMAFLVVPVVGGALGGLTGVALSWSYTRAANFSASKVYGKELLGGSHVEGS